MIPWKRKPWSYYSRQGESRRARIARGRNRGARPASAARRFAASPRFKSVGSRCGGNGRRAGRPRLSAVASMASSRRGKWILLDLEGPWLVVHLGMTGQFVVTAHDEPRQNHTHLVFTLDDGVHELRFRDVRRFGSAVRYAAARTSTPTSSGSGLVRSRSPSIRPTGTRPWRKPSAA